MFDTVIRGARVVDGTGAPAFQADVAIRGDRIAAVGDLAGELAGAVVDAAGLCLAPGFVDIHTHSDLSFLIDPTAQSKVRQGVTTEVVGNCGSSYGAPLLGPALEATAQRLERHAVGLEPSWRTMAGFMAALEARGAVIHTAHLVGHGTVRLAAMGAEARAPRPDELARMQDLVREAMEAGAVGLSTGLWYAPGSYATTDEVVALAKVVAAYGGIYTSHIRDESDYNVGLLAAVDEAIAVGRRAHVPVQISHFKCLGPGVWGQAAEVLRRVEAARAQGVDVAGDVYPYTASGSSIVGALVPRWALDGGTARLRARLRDDPEFRAKLGEGIAANLARRGGAERLVVASFPDPAVPGKSLRQLADERGSDPVRVTLELLAVAETPLVCHVMREEDLREFLRSPHSMIASDGSSIATDGPLGGGVPHPRNFGTFPRVLQRYWREEGLYGLEEAVRRMTSLPARRFGLADRGVIRPGYAADLCLFDPERVGEGSTFEQPLRYAEGIPHVIVAGRFVIRDGRFTGELPGRVLRRGLRAA